MFGERQIDDYLMSRAVFDSQRRDDRLGLSAPTSARAWLDERLARLREALDETNRLAQAGELPDVELDEKGRRRVSAALNKGEARKSLARTVFFYRLGEIRDRSYDNQRYRASG